MNITVNRYIELAQRALADGRTDEALSYLIWAMWAANPPHPTLSDL